MTWLPCDYKIKNLNGLYECLTNWRQFFVCLSSYWKVIQQSWLQLLPCFLTSPLLTLFSICFLFLLWAFTRLHFIKKSFWESLKDWRIRWKKVQLGSGTRLGSTFHGFLPFFSCLFGRIVLILIWFQRPLPPVTSKMTKLSLDSHKWLQAVQPGNGLMFWEAVLKTWSLTFSFSIQINIQ